MNDKIKTQIIGACRQQGCNDADAEHIAVSVLNTLQPLVADAARFRMMIHMGVHAESPETRLMDEITQDVSTQDLTDEQVMRAVIASVDVVREKFGDRP